MLILRQFFPWILFCTILMTMKSCCGQLNLLSILQNNGGPSLGILGDFLGKGRSGTANGTTDNKPKGGEIKVPCGAYNPFFQICCNGRIYHRVALFTTLCCGNYFYNNAIQMCCNGRPAARLGGTFLAKCCGTHSYNTQIQMCCDGRVQAKAIVNVCCGENVYNPEVQICCDGEIKHGATSVCPVKPVKKPVPNNNETMIDGI